MLFLPRGICSKRQNTLYTDNDTDDNGNEWETVGAKKTKNRKKLAQKSLVILVQLVLKIKRRKVKK